MKAIKNRLTKIANFIQHHDWYFEPFFNLKNPLLMVVLFCMSNYAAAACPSWYEGNWYNVGDVVEYEGSNYVATNENPGYIPTVSTWFWNPSQESCDGGASAQWCASWVDGQWYNVGDVVEYYGQNYVAVNPNPGYNPVISTWFWNPTSNSCGTSSGGGQSTTCAYWSEGSWYSAGDVVEFEGGYYIAEYDNPGYIPTVSTWFWQPTNSCSGANSGGSSSGGSAGSNDCGTQWYTARLTNYTSYPDPGSEECLYYNGCTWAGQFYGLQGKMSEGWVSENNIVAVHMKDWDWLGMKNIRLRQGGKEIMAKVYDACSDSDCNGCCTANLGGDGFLMDVEKYTMWRFGTGSGTVEFQVCYQSLAS